MRFVSYRHSDSQSLGLLEGDKVIALTVPTLRELLTGRPAGVDLVDHVRTLRSGISHPASDVQLLAPTLGRGRNIFAVGWNYTDHFEEGAASRSEERELPTYPTFFTKTPETIIGPADPIIIDSRVTRAWDYEAEIAIVLGSGGRNIELDDAEACIAGFTLANDVTARDIQRRHGGQWFKGKTLDDTCPLGPSVVTPDELNRGRPSGIELSVNGRALQSAKTEDMYFDFAAIIAELSVGMSLLPGDVILTGTPSGVGYVRHPPIWLADGDEIVVSSPGLGELRNPVLDRAMAVV